MHKLSLHATTPIDELAWPEKHENIDIDSPALEVFTDFHAVKPLVIEATTPAIETIALMKKSHVRMKIVIGRDGEFMGIVSQNHMDDQEILKKVAAGYTHEELTVADFMIPKDQLKAFDYAELCKANVGDIVDALKSTGQQHCLVVDASNHLIRGVISAGDIARKLKLAIDIGTESTFVNIFKSIHH